MRPKRLEQRAVCLGERRPRPVDPDVRRAGRRCHRLGAVKGWRNRPGHDVDREAVEAIEVPERAVLREARGAGQVSVERSHAGADRSAVPLGGRAEEREPGGPSAAARCAGPESLPTNRLASARIPIRAAEVGASGEVHDGGARVGRARGRRPERALARRSRGGAGPCRAHGQPPAQRAEVRGRPALGCPVRGARRDGDEGLAGDASTRATKPPRGVEHLAGRGDPWRGAALTSRMRGASPGGASREAGQGGQVAAADRGGESPVVDDHVRVARGPREPRPDGSRARRARLAHIRLGGESGPGRPGSATPRALGKRTQRSKRRRRSRAGAHQAGRGARACGTRQGLAGPCRRTPTSGRAERRARGIRTSSRASGKRSAIARIAGSAMTASPSGFGSADQDAIGPEINRRRVRCLHGAVDPVTDPTMAFGDMSCQERRPVRAASSSTTPSGAPRGGQIRRWPAS